MAFEAFNRWVGSIGKENAGENYAQFTNQLGNDLGSTLDSITGKRRDELEQAQFDYEKEWNQQERDRQDNAHQREAADLAAAGFSKWNAAGMGGSPGGNIRPAERSTQGEAQKQQFAFGTASAVMNIIQGLAQANKTQEETGLIRDTRAGKVEELSLGNQLKRLEVDYAGKSLDNRLALLGKEVNKVDLDNNWKVVSLAEKQQLLTYLAEKSGLSRNLRTDSGWLFRIPNEVSDVLEYKAKLLAYDIAKYNKDYATDKNMWIGPPSTPGIGVSVADTVAGYVEDRYNKGVDTINKVINGVAEWITGILKGRGTRSF